ncbi:MAG TPA: RluA family pseudouridine synthase [Marinobacter sp.]|nr:RluA family pseudouridine synthase [Marinobacter sp.]
MRKLFDLTVDQAAVAVDVLAAASGLSRQRIKDAMAKGACWWTVKGKQVRLRKAKRELKAGTRIQLYYDEHVLARAPEPPQLLENKGRYSVWCKPRGLLSQGSQWGDHCSLLRLAEIQLNKPCYLVHRLDGDATGLMLIAHDGKAAAALSGLFAGRTVTKVYRATVDGILSADNLLLDSALDGKPAVSRVTTLSQDENSNTSEVSVRIETGRKHQIRRHLAGAGHPIIGDRLYGSASASGLQLIAVELGFHCPVAKTAVTYRLPQVSAF